MGSIVAVIFGKQNLPGFTVVCHFWLDYKPNKGKDFVSFTTVFSIYKSAENNVDTRYIFM